MKSKVYYIDSRATYKENLLLKIGKLLKAAELPKMISERDLVAVKLHFGEKGNTAFIRPVFIRKLVEVIKDAGGCPFLTDTNTLYAGTRSSAPAHLTTAIQNGFAFAVVDAPIIIADGLRGRSDAAVEINQKRFERVYIGAEILRADCLVSAAHFTGHDFTGFGGTLKNLAMGCASRRGKMAQHSGVAPKVRVKKCTGCGDCASHCAAGAIALSDGSASIDPETCTGCGECFILCQNDAIRIKHNRSIPVFMENMAEYALGALSGKQDRALFLNFLLRVSPGCDCVPYNDSPFVGDIGIIASTDPVAVDQASVDLVNQQPVLAGSCLRTHTNPGEDKFKALFPHVDWSIQLEYAEQIGLGRRDYELVTI